MTEAPLIWIIAGEPSGDQLAARLMAALKAETDGAVRFAGIGGARMAEQGLQSLFPIEDLSVMGLLEVLPHLPVILRRLRQATAAVRAARPAALVTVDSPSFTLEVSHRLKGEGFPLIHYVAPQVWAWKPWRAKKMAGYLDHLLALLPFEPPYFEPHGLKTSFVGHPAVEQAKESSDPAELRRRLGLDRSSPLLCLLPGSRRTEVKRMAPLFGATLALLAPRFPGLHAVVPTVEGVAALVDAEASAWPVPSHIVTGASDKLAAFRAADAALAASGTVAVELAVAELPSVITYRVNALSAAIARRLLKVRFASIPNLVLDREVQPELLQNQAQPEALAEAVGRLLSDESERQAQIAGCREATAALGGGEVSPSTRAARVVLQVIAQSRGAAATT